VELLLDCTTKSLSFPNPSLSESSDVVAARYPYFTQF